MHNDHYNNENDQLQLIIIRFAEVFSATFKTVIKNTMIFTLNPTYQD